MKPAGGETRVAWRQALGAGVLLGLALGCAWLEHSGSELRLTRVALIAAAGTLAVIAVALLWPARAGVAGGAAWSRRLGFQFAAAGAPFFALVAVLALVAFVTGNNLLYLLVSVLLAILLVSGVTSALNLAGMVLRFRHPDEIFAGEAVPVEFTLSNEKSWWPSFSLTITASSAGLGAAGAGEAAMPPLYFVHVPRRDSVRRHSRLQFSRRGRYAAASFTLATRFPFALVNKRRRFEPTAQDSTLLVYPAPATTPLGPELLAWLGLHWERHERGSGQELYRIRPHEFGDSARSVHWKASARAQELRVREFAQDGAWRVRLRLAFPPGMAADEAEEAISLCAGLVVQMCAAEYWLAFEGEHAGEPGPDGAPVAGLSLPLQPAVLQRRAILEYLAVVDPATPAEPATSGFEGEDALELDLVEMLRMG